MSEDTDCLRALNDEFRRKLPKGHTFMTPGIAALGEEAVARLIQTLRTYDDFCRRKIHMRSMTLGPSNSPASQCSSKSTTTTRI